MLKIRFSETLRCSTTVFQSRIFLEGLFGHTGHRGLKYRTNTASTSLLLHGLNRITMNQTKTLDPGYPLEEHDEDIAQCVVFDLELLPLVRRVIVRMSYVLEGAAADWHRGSPTISLASIRKESQAVLMELGNRNSMAAIGKHCFQTQ